MQDDVTPKKTSPFRNSHGLAIESPYAFVKNWLAKHPRGKIFVGCDSKVRGKYAKYSTAICLWNIGRGVSEIYKNETVPRPPDSYTRLWAEVTRAVETAEILKDLGEITVHVDIITTPNSAAINCMMPALV